MNENEFHEIIEIVSKIGELIIQMRNEYKIFEKIDNIKLYHYCSMSFIVHNFKVFFTT